MVASTVSLQAYVQRTIIKVLAPQVAATNVHATVISRSKQEYSSFYQCSSDALIIYRLLLHLKLRNIKLVIDVDLLQGTLDRITDFQIWSVRLSNGSNHRLITLREI